MMFWGLCGDSVWSHKTGQNIYCWYWGGYGVCRRWFFTVLPSYLNNVTAIAYYNYHMIWHACIWSVILEPIMVWQRTNIWCFYISLRQVPVNSELINGEYQVRNCFNSEKNWMDIDNELIQNQRIDLITLTLSYFWIACIHNCFCFEECDWLLLNKFWWWSYIQWCQLPGVILSSQSDITGWFTVITLGNTLPPHGDVLVQEHSTNKSVR